MDALPPGARLVYVTPSHQYPLGMAMSLPRRIALLAWAERHDAAIIEDDYDSEFRYGGRPIEPLQTLDTSGRVIYVGSLSKTMLPTLRLGFVVTPPPLREAVQRGEVRDRLAHAAAGPGGTRQLHRRGLAGAARPQAAQRLPRAAPDLLEGLATELADDLAVIPSVRGAARQRHWQHGCRSKVEQVALHAEADGVGVQRLSWFRGEQPPLAGLALGYGGIAADHIGEGLRRLHAAFHPA